MSSTYNWCLCSVCRGEKWKAYSTIKKHERNDTVRQVHAAGQSVLESLGLSSAMGQPVSGSGTVGSPAGQQLTASSTLRQEDGSLDDEEMDTSGAGKHTSDDEMDVDEMGQDPPYQTQRTRSDEPSDEDMDQGDGTLTPPSSPPRQPPRNPDQSEDEDEETDMAARRAATLEALEKRRAAEAEARHAAEQAHSTMFPRERNSDFLPENELDDVIPILEDLKLSQSFIDALRNATLDSTIEPLSDEVLDFIQNPPHAQVSIEDDPDLRLSIDLYLAVENAAEVVYMTARDAILRRFPQCHLLTFHEVKRKVEELTGVSPVYRDMCINSCIGFTGPIKDAIVCPFCGEQRYHEGTKVARKRFITLLLAPQLQALWRTPEGARLLQYRREYTARVVAGMAEDGTRSTPFTDLFDGLDYLEAWEDGRIKDGDMVLVLSIDGAQLYRSKVSECWVYIWVVFDLAPDRRYKKKYVFPGGFIPGPNKPKNLDSFLFPGLFHLSALQREGLKIWRADLNIVFFSHPFLALATADGPAMATMSGLVGHQGKIHCRIRCPISGRRKDGGSQYYPARLKPTGNYAVAGSDHPDVNLAELLTNFNSLEAEERYRRELSLVMKSKDQAEYQRNRLQTGICRPTIFSGLPTRHVLGIPRMFPLDIMHLPALNIPDLMIPLWRGTFVHATTDNPADWPWAVLKGDVWKQHGQAVADITPFIPGSFDRPPRNPAEKINSGYKAWEYLLYFFCIGPALLYGILPMPYWKNYCQCARAFSLLMQLEISQEDLQEAYELLIQFSNGFEELYYQCREDRLHFVRPCIHTVSHFPPETERIGPGIVYAQWAIERMIGSLGLEMRQPSNMFSNFEQRGVRRCQVNALKALIPDLEVEKPLIPRGGHDIGGGYVLLRAKDRSPRSVRDNELSAIQAYVVGKQGDPQARGLRKVIRWARLRLPNGQIARTHWKETQRSVRPVRRARCVKCQVQNCERIGEVLYFTQLDVNDGKMSVAVLSLLGLPDANMLKDSSEMYWSAQHLGDNGIMCIDVKHIKSVVILAPDFQYATSHHDGSEINRWFVSHRPGIALMERLGYVEDFEEE